ncbi:hypothetical protein PAMP_023498 [Pampus punctatissimus]
MMSLMWVAKDMAGITGSILLLCLISLTNANTSPTINKLSYEVCEDIPIGEIAFTVSASDPEGNPLTFSITGGDQAYFVINRDSGTVSVKNRLDRENGDTMILRVDVSDGAYTTSRNLTIILNDANDNKPIFEKPSYDCDIPETTPPNTLLFRVRATDADTSSAAVIKYAIDEVTPTDGFSLFSITTKGEVMLNGRLNYTDLSTFYRLKINATDGGGQCHYDKTDFFSSVVYSFVTVVDEADLDPQFIGLPYTGTVKENTEVGVSVFRVTAIDRDIGVNDDIIYSIEHSTADGLFRISEDEGIIYVQSNIDRENVSDTVTLTVKATESKTNIHGDFANTTTEVRINIIDINDNRPEFYKCGDPEDVRSCVLASHFTGEVFEHSLGSVFINMTVRDKDRSANTKLSLDGSDKEVFSVEPALARSDSIVQLLVKQPQQLDFEEKNQMVLQVIAVDQEDTNFRTTATVTILILDTNDNSPKFLKDTYKLEVAEHSPVGTTLATITAVDPDTMDQGNITYILLPESIRLYFDVEPDTGTVYVKNETLLDREVRSLYSATLQARDSEGKPGTTVLEITVTDINDQPPVFNRDTYLAFVAEGGQLELKIEATDADDPNTENSQIVYAIMPSKYSSNFTINPNTGVLRNKNELDREALDPELDGRIELNITATDKGSPPLSSIVKVIINVEDVNDNVPEFEASSYKFSVKEGEKGAFVGSVEAQDLDQTTDFDRISFSIIDGSFGSFVIRTFAAGQGYRGNITVDPDIELDYESTHKHFKLRVEAADLAQKTAEVWVEVDVLDVNDERPEFNPTAPVTVKENTTISGAVGHFTGKDKDGNHSLIYQLESMECRCNGSLTPCNYFILEPTGEVKLNPEQTMDYENCTQVLVEARVVDEYTEKGENDSVTTGLMEIIIEDINDNAPEFIYSDVVFVVVSETASKGTPIAEVTAIDLDSGVNRQIEFKVTQVHFEDINNHTSDMGMLFEAVTTQQKDIYVGIIQSTEGLKLTLKGKYLVTVSATDTGGLSTSTVLEIFTIDDSYKVELKFGLSKPEVEQNMGTIIRELTTATMASVQVVSVGSPDESRDMSGTTMVAYFVYSNGTALNSIEVEKKLSDPEHFPSLANLGLMYIGNSVVQIQEVDPIKFILLGMVGGLIIVAAVLTTSLLCTRRNYRRKLKASKAMNSASMMVSDNQKSGPVVPGTNKYTMEGANPVINLLYNTAILDTDDKTIDFDKVSLNSLDSNDLAISVKDMKPITEEEENDELPQFVQPLDAVLAQQGQKKGSSNGPVGFVNPAFSTTDL